MIVGRKVHLDFHRVSREEFEQKRREYHQTLQASYFASHRIVGTEVYIARRGDSMWTITQRFARVAGLADTAVQPGPGSRRPASGDADRDAARGAGRRQAELK